MYSTDEPQGKFGVSIDKELITVKGRELPPPGIGYRGAGPVTPENGGWLMKKVKVFKPGRPIGTWTYLLVGTDADRDLLKATVGEFAVFMSQDMGINITPKPTLVANVGPAVTDNEPALRATFKQLAAQPHRPEFVLVVLGAKSTVTYNMVKKFADVDFGFPTVCVVQNKLLQSQGQKGYFANVGLKVNLKFGGVNHSIKDIEHMKANKRMFVGYDVTHPTNLGPGAANAPSIVALVASVDGDLAQWPAATWQNPARQEMVEQVFVEHFKGRLKLWQSKNQNRLPDDLVIFRDGVSEGQFTTVLKDELPFIRQACQELYPAERVPRIALIVSVKRHQTRFYPTDPAHAPGKSKSPRQGTVVDRGVTNVRYWDFFLQAHASLQGQYFPGVLMIVFIDQHTCLGTARPAHYTVLLDEIFRPDHGAKAADVLEKLTHDMCYLYGRATKAVSICPPAYYADLACTRARIHKHELFEDDGFSDTSSQQGRRHDAEGRNVHENLKNTMFYI